MTNIAKPLKPLNLGSFGFGQTMPSDPKILSGGPLPR